MITPIPDEDQWEDDPSAVIDLVELQAPSTGRRIRRTRRSAQTRRELNECFEGLIAQLSSLKL